MSELVFNRFLSLKEFWLKLFLWLCPIKGLMAIPKHIMCCIFYTFCAFKHVSFEAALLCNFWKASNLLVVPLYRERKKPCIQQILNLQPLDDDVQQCLTI